MKMFLFNLQLLGGGGGGTQLVLFHLAIQENNDIEPRFAQSELYH